MSEDVRVMLVDLVKAHAKKVNQDMRAENYTGFDREYLKAPMKEREALCARALKELKV